MKQLSFFLAVSLFSVFCFSCSKPHPGTGGSYPKNVNILYKVSSTTANKLNVISYSNESGTLNSLDAPTLPFSKTLSKTVSRYEIVTVGFQANPAQDVKLEIYVDGQLVKSQQSVSVLSSLAYTFQ